MGKKYLGLDMGSRTAKGVIIVDGEIFTAIRPTGFQMQKTQNVKSNRVRASGRDVGSSG